MSADNDGISTLNIDKYSVVLLDVAGTLTSTSYVKDTLFPYVCAQAEDYLKTNWEETEVKEAIKKLQTGDDALDLSAATNLVKELTEKNSTNEGLKVIQGLISKKGYESEEIKAHIFDDVPSVFESLSKNKRIAIYSTGTIESQKLFFGHTTRGDLTSHISKYFDQTVGLKTESSSYEKIAKEFEISPEEMVFITDLAEEAKAAKTAGVVPFLIKREGNDPLPENITGDYTVISSLNDLTTENGGKRKISDETDSSEVPPTKVAKTEETDVKTPSSDAVESDKKAVENVPQQSEGEPMEVDAADVKMDVSVASSETVDDKSQTEKIKTDDKEMENDKTDCKEDSNKDGLDVKSTEESKQLIENDKIKENSNENDTIKEKDEKEVNEKDIMEETVNENNKVEVVANEKDKTEEVVEKKDKIEENKVEDAADKNKVEETAKENNKTKETTNENNKVEQSEIVNNKIEITTSSCDKIEGPAEENKATKEITNESEVDQTADKKTVEENTNKDAEENKKEPEIVDNNPEKTVVSEEKKECDKVDTTNSKVVKETCDKVVKEAEIVGKSQPEKTEVNEISSTSTANECDKVDKTVTDVSDETAQNNADDKKTDETNDKTEITENANKKEETNNGTEENTLTNGNENANKSVVTNGDSEQNQTAEIKVKQLETNPESTPVSVEV